ncbi:transposase family protein [Streptomonospora litoralis]|uniref:H repeat-associated protein N-terminal domain-containing protein n=1 Tax=Streptomonospora litoralis TaxID=2498135 RepID=A0A4P6Q8L1_9ACTN|nr:transposase family protein [Streptomonospora litoralis]QBI55444.1 hypothetical protein EKD16_18400 [Streptomonospora litoralis]
MPAPALASPIAPSADPRAAREIRHRLSCIVTIGLCAVVAGARSIAAIGQWAANAPQHTLARLAARTAGEHALEASAPAASTASHDQTDPVLATAETN